jgi:oligopeptidase B
MMCHLIAGPLLASVALAEPPMPPRAEKIPHTREIHGRVLEDPWFWLRERANPKVIELLRAENAYFDAVTAPTLGLRKKLYDEMLGHIQQTDLSVPYREHGYVYYSRTVEGKPYQIHCRRKGSMEGGGAEEVMLDVNELAAGKSFLIVRPIAVSPDARVLAYGEDPTGGRVFTVRFKDLSTGTLLPDTIEGASSDLVWYNDSKTVAYTTVDAAVRSDKAWRRRLGDAPAEKVLLRHETDEKFGVGLSKTLDEKCILMSMGSHKTTEVWFARADNPVAQFLVIEPRREGVEYRVDHARDGFLITHNDGALNFEIVQAPEDSPGRAHWKRLIRHSDSVYLLGTLAFKDYLVIRTREKGVPVLRIRNWADGAEHRIEMPEESYAADLGMNTEFHSTEVRFSYASLTTPQSVFDYDMGTRQRKLLKEQPVPGYERGGYETERIYAKASDGAEVPIAIVHRKGVKLDGSNPLLLTGYGSYGANSDARFNSNWLPLLDRGVVCAVAQIRGGSEKGRAWYEDGRMMHKRNTFTDFIAAAEELVKRGYTSPERLAIRGGSAGGLLMGAVVNMRPDLFRVCVADVPFVDVINTMLDPSLPLTVEEYDQWGNPNEKAAFEYIASYSPYDNVGVGGKKEYPSILATVGLNDSNVPYWEGTKWVQKLRENASGGAGVGGRPILLHVNMDTGHGGNSDRYKRLDEEAWRYAFMLSELGIGK